MTYKFKVYRKEFYDSVDGFQSMLGISQFTKALEKYGLAEHIRKRRTKHAYCGAPSSVHLKDYTADFFLFGYKYSERADFFQKVTALKDDPEICRWFWIGD